MPDPKTGNYRNSGVVTSHWSYGQRIIQAEFAVGDPLMSVLTMFYCTREWKSATSLIPPPPPLPLNLDSKDLSHGPILRAQLDFIALKSDILILGEKDIIIILR